MGLSQGGDDVGGVLGWELLDQVEHRAAEHSLAPSSRSLLV
jgi:hypothetical protein